MQRKNRPLHSALFGIFAFFFLSLSRDLFEKKKKGNVTARQNKVGRLTGTVRCAV
jgi:hypothetical protein